MEKRVQIPVLNVRMERSVSEAIVVLTVLAMNQLARNARALSASS